jgi:DNA-directed RNA polymerase subunit RPC12/RpoP
MKFVTLANVADSYQAHFVKEALAQKGIECMVINENSANLLQHAGSLGECVLIRVLEKDYMTAKQVVDKLKTETAEITCPNCGSANVEYGKGGKNTLMRMGMIFSFLFVSPGRMRLTYVCNDCNTEFRKSSI